MPLPSFLAPEVAREVLTEVARLKARGETWAFVAQQLQMDEDACARLPFRYRREWEEDFAFAANQFVNEVATLAVKKAHALVEQTTDARALSVLMQAMFRFMGITWLAKQFRLKQPTPQPKPVAQPPAHPLERPPTPPAPRVEPAPEETPLNADPDDLTPAEVARIDLLIQNFPEADDLVEAIKHLEPVIHEKCERRAAQMKQTEQAPPASAPSWWRRLYTRFTAACLLALGLSSTRPPDQ